MPSIDIINDYFSFSQQADWMEWPGDFTGAFLRVPHGFCWRAVSVIFSLNDTGFHSKKKEVKVRVYLEVITHQEGKRKDFMSFLSL